MPSQTGAPQTVECLENDEAMSFSVAKFSASDNVDFLLSFGLKIGVPYVGCPYLAFVVLP